MAVLLDDFGDDFGVLLVVGVHGEISLVNCYKKMVGNGWEVRGIL